MTAAAACRALAVVLLVSAMHVATPPAAVASTIGGCAGLASIATDDDLTLPTTQDGYATTAVFTYMRFFLHTGVCEPHWADQATGYIAGWCGLGGGIAATEGGNFFHHIEIGALHIVTGQVQGAWTMTADVIGTYDDCRWGAHRFQLAGASAATPCGAAVGAMWTGAAPWPSATVEVVPYACA